MSDSLAVIGHSRTTAERRLVGGAVTDRIRHSNRPRRYQSESFSADKSDLRKRLRRLGDSDAGFAEAVAAAQLADVALVFVGEAKEMVGDSSVKEYARSTGSANGSGKSDPGHEKTDDSLY
jgi:hypothetical protein